MKRMSGLAILSAGTVVLTGCGAAAGSSSASSGPRTTPSAATPTAATSAATPTAATSAATPTAATATTPATTSAVPVACENAAQKELVAVVKRIYAQAVNGRNETASVNRIGRSRRLARAVAAGDPAAAQAALGPLIKNQITAIVVRSASGTILARHGTAGAHAPQGAAIVDQGRTVGSFVLSVSDDRAFTSLVHGLTGVTATFGPSRVAGADHALAATAFPSGHQTISLTMPSIPSTVCGTTAGDTRLRTIGLVGQNLAVDEERGPGAQRTIRHAEHDAAFRKAVIAGDPAGVRAAIVGFFQDSRYHVVRVRAWNGSRLINDVGGPYVLDPAVGTIQQGGKVAGRFMLAIQDDTGYIKLMHRFTGARVVLHMAGKTVPGSNLYPGPAYAKGLTRTVDHGVSYRSYGLLATAFPSSPLQVSLLVR